MSSDDTLLQTALIIITVIVLLPLLMMALVMPMMWFWGGGHMWNGGMWNGTGATWAPLLMWVIFLAVIVGIGSLLYRAVRSPASRETDPALEELRNAYARGDLSDEEFEQRRRKLQTRDEN
ncbi:SHOCT domain-containing protein [Natronolimnohabitans innermongolicus]|uniref:SHOCT domain-containing protein n=1 Tax=Natronolimnohabitans innermongolicus JCM 12255 TaxID=1227499 RepID=L9X6Y4_9EURY|nr:SHOCT domain-containing protein [Natronolimnohabitans innermongolicus]ELY57470.1 hypothetical protein C493_08291 [Natronolimnohabitans innermongolicus JCM 12255]